MFCRVADWCSFKLNSRSTLLHFVFLMSYVSAAEGGTKPRTCSFSFYFRSPTCGSSPVVMLGTCAMIISWGAPNWEQASNYGWIVLCKSLCHSTHTSWKQGTFNPFREVKQLFFTGFQMSVLRRLDNIIERLDAHEKLLRTMESNSSSHSAEKLSSIMEDIIPRPLDAREDIEEFNRKLEDASLAKLVVSVPYLYSACNLTMCE